MIRMHPYMQGLLKLGVLRWEGLWGAHDGGLWGASCHALFLLGPRHNGEEDSQIMEYRT